MSSASRRASAVRIYRLFNPASGVSYFELGQSRDAHGGDKPHCLQDRLDPGTELLDSRSAVLRSRQRPDPKGREFFLEREAAEAMIDEVREDEPLLAEDLRVKAIELD
jgi:hypothetical protein